MSLDVTLYDNEDKVLYDSNITHNLGEMADKAGIYEALWRPHRLKKGYNIPEDNHKAESEFEDNSVTYAKEIIPIIEKGLLDMVLRPAYYKQFDSPNGWGTYKHFVPFISEYLEALKHNPDAIVKTDR